MKYAAIYVVVLFGLFFDARLSLAGFTRYYVSDLDDSFSVIVARVNYVAEDHSDEKRGTTTATHQLDIEPLFNLTGPLDPSRIRSLSALIIVSDFASSIQVVPGKGDIILAVIENTHRDGEPIYGICSEACDFMPDAHGCVIIKRFNDKRIWETLEKLRKGREDEAKEKAKEGEKPKNDNGYKRG